MAEIPEEKIAEIRDRLDIVAVIGRSVALKQAGRSWKGCCPFHQEKTPSFHVDPERKLYHCFGCKAGGDVFRFVMEYEGRTFPETVRALAAEVGVLVPERQGPPDPRADAAKKRRLRLQEANEKAAELFAYWLDRDPRGESGRRHLRDRGIDGSIASRFGLGFAPLRNDLRARLVEAGVHETVLQEAGLLARGESGLYERFRGRLMVPIRDGEGRTIAFGARVVEGDHPAKYLNSPETPIYRKSEVLFGLNEARPHIRRESAAVVVEGYFDVMALAQAGVENVVATCGTALTKEHLRLLSRHTRDVFLVFDGDAAGSEAAYRTYGVSMEVPGVTVRVVSLPEGEDPDTFVRREGAGAFRELCTASLPLAEVLIERALEGVGQAVEDRVRAVERVRPYLDRVTDPLVYRLYLQRVADRLGLEERTLLHTLRSGLTRRGDERRERDAPAPSEPISTPLPGDEEALCLLLLEQPGLLDDPNAEACLADVVDDRARSLVASILDQWRRTQGVNVGAVLEDLTDASMRSRWRDHIAQMALMDSGSRGENERVGDSARKLELLAGRLARQAEVRRQRALARETSRISDPVERARRIQATKSLGRPGTPKVRA